MPRYKAQVKRFLYENVFDEEMFDNENVDKGGHQKSEISELVNLKVDGAFISGLLESLEHRKASRKNNRFYQEMYTHSTVETDHGIDRLPINSSEGEVKFVEHIIHKARDESIPFDDLSRIIRIVGDTGQGKTFFLNNLITKYSDRLNQSKVLWIRTSLTQIYEGWSLMERHMHQFVYIVTKHYIKNNIIGDFQSDTDFTVDDLESYYRQHSSDLIIPSTIANVHEGGKEIDFQIVKNDIRDFKNAGKKWSLKNSRDQTPGAIKPQHRCVSADSYYLIYNFLKHRGWHFVFTIDGLDPYLATDDYYEKFVIWYAQSFNLRDNEAFSALFIYVMRKSSFDWALAFMDGYEHLITNSVRFIDEHYRKYTDITYYEIEKIEPVAILEKRLSWWIKHRSEKAIDNSSHEKYFYCVCQYISLALKIDYSDVLPYVYNMLNGNTRELINIFEECAKCLYQLLKSDLSEYSDISTGLNEFDYKVNEILRPISSQSDFTKLIINEERDNVYDGNDFSALHKNTINGKLRSQVYRIYGPLVKGSFVYQNDPFSFIEDKKHPLGFKMIPFYRNDGTNSYGVLGNIYSYPFELLSDENCRTRFPATEEESKFSGEGSLFAYCRLIILHYLRRHCCDDNNKEVTFTPKNYNEMLDDFRSLGISEISFSSDCRYLDSYRLVNFGFNLIGPNKTIYKLMLTNLGKYMMDSASKEPHYFIHCFNSIPLSVKLWEAPNFIQTHNHFGLIYHFERLNSEEKETRQKIIAKHMKNRLLIANYFNRFFEEQKRRLIHGEAFNSLNKTKQVRLSLVLDDVSDTLVQLLKGMEDISLKQIYSAKDKNLPLFSYINEYFMNEN